ncbi:hypothetical protein Tco_0227692 [Tanacetum coccineum]
MWGGKVITEASVRRDLQLHDEEGTNCLPNATIFEELTRMSAKTTAWNEFSSTMASAIILCLNKQMERVSSHKRIYVTPSHTKKIFGNMKRVGKGFSGRETPLFPTMVVHNQEEMGEGLTMPIDPHHTPIITQPSSSQHQKKQKSRRPKKKDTEVPQPSGPTNVADEDSMTLKELMDFLPNCNKECLTWRTQNASSTGRFQRMHLNNGGKIDDIDKDAEITLVDETRNLFDKAMKRVNTFVDMDTKLVKESSKKGDAEMAQESSSKRAGDELEQESTKKQKVDEDKETTEFQSLMKIVLDEEEVAIDAIPLFNFCHFCVLKFSLIVL